MHAITAAKLKNAHSSESTAHLPYAIWTDAAERQGFPNVSRLFCAISHAEIVHATNHFRELKGERGDAQSASKAVFGLGSTSQNLEGGIDGETYEITEMYPTYLKTANFQKEMGAELSFHYALSAEKIHAAHFRKTKEAVDSTERM
jgi:rubrerythrin